MDGTLSTSLYIDGSEADAAKHSVIEMLLAHSKLALASPNAAIDMTWNASGAALPEASIFQ